MAIYCNIYFKGASGAVVQAGASDGDTVTLESYNPNQAFQNFQIVANDGPGSSGGVAFVNFASGAPLSICAQGSNQPLVMQPFKPGDSDLDTWLIQWSPTGLYIISQTFSESWNDQGGGYNSGDNVILYSLKGDPPNSQLAIAYSGGTIEP